MITIDVVACTGGSLVLFTYALLAYYLFAASESNSNLLMAPFKNCMCVWTVLCFFSAAASVILFLTVREYEGVSVDALAIFLFSAASWAPLAVLDVKYRKPCTLSLLGLCMLATPCAWVVFFVSGPPVTFINFVLFMWSFTHHAIFDSWIWFALYIEQRNCPPLRTRV